MAVQKNFVVKNGIEVNNNLIFADTGSNKVGIATTSVKYTLHVNGGIGATSSVVTGVSTVNDLIIGGKVSVGSSFGVAGQYLVSTGTGVTWGAVPTVRSTDVQTAGVGTDRFSTSYTVGLLDVYVNGVKLSSNEYTATDSATVILDDACFGGETVEFISYSPFGIGVGGSSIQGITVLEEGSPVGSALQVTSINFVGASVTAVGSGIGVTVYITDTNTSSSSYWAQTGAGIHTLSNVGVGTTNPRFALEVGAVGASGTSLYVNGDARITGILTVGSSSITLNGSSNTINVGSGVTIDGGAGTISATSIVVSGTTLTGAAVTSITAGSGISVDQSTGNVTITATGGGSSSQWVTTAAGIHTLSSVGIGTTNPTSALTVKGNTSLETLNVSGVSTFRNNVNFGTQCSISTSGNSLTISADGDITLASYQGNTKIISQPGASLLSVDASDVSLYYQVSAGPSGSEKRLQTLGTGVTVTGTTFTNQLSVSGIATIGTGVTIYGNSGIVSATTFIGNFSGSITDATNLTGGYANASSLNVSGIATISAGRIQADASANLRFGNLPAGSGSSRNIAIGDQVLASLSGGQGRNIGIGELSYYDTTTGQYNIGIGERAGQKVSTGSYNVILGAYDGQTGLDIRTLSNNVVIADGQGNIRQYINSSGNVGIKTTVVTEALTVAGIVSATSFYGTLNAGQLTGSLPAIDGSALINVVGSGSGVVIQDDATPVGTAATIDFGSNLSVSFASGIATVSGASSVSAATTAYGLAGTPNLSVGYTTATTFKVGSSTLTDGSLNLEGNIYSGNLVFSNRNLLFTGGWDGGSNYGDFIFQQRSSFGGLSEVARIFGATGAATFNGTTKLAGISTFTSTGISILTNLNSSGIITASSFSGSASGLTNIPSGQLTGALPAIDGSALLNVTAAGTGVAVRDDGTPVGSATTIDFGTGLDVTFSSGIATVTASGGSLQSRTIVTGVTTSIANNGIGNTNITGFKSYALMKVGLSTAGWLRLYTDSTSRANDASRSQGVDPSPGSGVIAEVITTGISTTQIITPFVMGGNLDNPIDTTIYASITNLSGTTQAITANLTILQLEA